METVTWGKYSTGANEAPNKTDSETRLNPGIIQSMLAPPGYL